MNPTDNLSDIPNEPRRNKQRRSISVLQLTTALALIALPATVLFPIIARPVPPPPVAIATLHPDQPTVYTRESLVDIWTSGKFRQQLRDKRREAMLDLKRLEHSK